MRMTDDGDDDNNNNSFWRSSTRAQLMEQTGYETQPVSLLGFLFSISFCSSFAFDHAQNVCQESDGEFM